MIPIVYPTSMQLKPVVMQYHKQYKDQVEKFEEFMKLNPGLKVDIALNLFSQGGSNKSYANARKPSKLHIDEDEKYENDKRLDEFKKSRRIGIKGAKLCARLQSNNLSLMELEDTVIGYESHNRALKAKHGTLDQNQIN